MPYAGGEIRFEHLDGIYNHEELILEKLNNDRPAFSRPSATSLICFVLNESEVTANVVSAISDALINTPKRFMKVCFVGTDKRTERALKVSLKERTFALAFIDDLEKAKEWLVKE